jgi:hypothetical protein
MHIAQLTDSIAENGDVRLPILVFLDMMNRAIQVVQEPGIKEYVEGIVTMDDLKWVSMVIQADRLYNPEIQLDETLPPEVKQLLGAPPAPAVGPEPQLGMSMSISDPPANIATLLGLNIDNLADEILAVRSWNFDAFDLDAKSNHQPLTFTGFVLFHTLGFASKFNIPNSTIINFLREVERHHNPNNPYHNSLKAATVVSSVGFFLDTCGVNALLSPLESFSLFLSSIILNVSHPGRSACFLQRTNHPLALQYNNVSVIENASLFTAFQILGNEDSNIFANLQKADANNLRGMIINLVLASDMVNHYPLLTKFGTKLIDTSAGRLDVLREGDRILLTKILLHASDICIAAKRLPLFNKWFEQVIAEMYLQGDEEKSMELLASLFMDRTEPQETHCQLSFINVVVAPLYECLIEFLGEFCRSFDGGIVGDQIRRHMDYSRKKLSGAEGLDAQESEMKPLI